MNSLLEFTELLKNRLTDLLLIEADNDKHVFCILPMDIGQHLRNRLIGFAAFMNQ